MNETCNNCGEDPNKKKHKAFGQPGLFEIEQLYPPEFFKSYDEADYEEPPISPEQAWRITLGVARAMYIASHPTIGDLERRSTALVGQP